MSADAGSDVVHRLDRLYEFERAPVTADQPAARLVLRRALRRRARGGHRVRDRGAARELRGERHRHRLRPPARQPAGGALLDLRLRPDRGRARGSPSTGTCGRSPAPASPSSTTCCNAVMYCILAGAMITVSASAVRLLFGIPAQTKWYPEDMRFVLVVLGVGAVVVTLAILGFKRLAQFAVVCSPVDVPDVRRGGGRHAAGARVGPARREDRRARRPLGDRQPDDLEGRLRARVGRARLLARGGLRLDLQPRHARGPVGHGDLPLREEAGATASSPPSACTSATTSPGSARG